MRMFKKVCVFCGSSMGGRPEYEKEVMLLGQLLAQNGIELIYGGGNVGLMGVLSRTVLANNGKVTGIIPKKIYERVDHVELTELKVVQTMHERKALMYELADGFIALPGGIGTLEELAEAFTWNQLGYHSKPIGIFNIHKFYDGLLEFFAHAEGEGFLKAGHIEQLVVETDPTTLLHRMAEVELKEISKWQQEK